MAQMEWTPDDIAQIADRGLTPEQVSAQLLQFQNGFPSIRLDRPCTVDDGITRLSEDRYERLETLYGDVVASGRVIKFVPASGAGTRMFKHLLAVWYENKKLVRADLEGNQDEDSAATLKFFENLPRYAFYNALVDTMGKQTLESHLSSGEYAGILEALLSDQELGYPDRPKGVLPFHRYEGYSRTPIEEHLAESIAYAKDQTNVARIHFTVSSEHIEGIGKHIDAIRSRYEGPDTSLEITLSVQKDATDIIATDLDNQPFRDREGHLVFRAGGHGALLENLNDLQGDIVFIKNIDNVISDDRIEEISRYKRQLGGLLIEIQTQIFEYLRTLHGENADRKTLDEVADFLRQTLCVTVPEDLTRQSMRERCAYFIHKLNRPLRVCGMVKNTGAPGGGPFWVAHEDGTQSLQIVESAQVDETSEAQQSIFRHSTHFNPVDLVCGIRDYTGQPFNLRNYRNPNTGFISTKSFEGVPLKAMEHPGLWNGSMAEWNTIFVEVPGITFNPVKTIDDILRPEHQPSNL